MAEFISYFPGQNLNNFQSQQKLKEWISLNDHDDYFVLFEVNCVSCGDLDKFISAIFSGSVQSFQVQFILWGTKLESDCVVMHRSGLTIVMPANL